MIDLEAQREAAFQEWWTTYGQPYEAAVISRGGTPWTTDIAERRELWMRRYVRPAGTDNDLSVIRRPEYRTDTAVPSPQRHAEPLSPAAAVDSPDGRSAA